MGRNWSIVQQKVVIEYVSSGRKTIDLHTMWGWENKKDYHQASDAKAPDRTFKTNLDMNPYKESVSSVNDGVKKEFSINIDEDMVVSAYINKNNTFPEVAVHNSPSRYVQDELQSNVLSSNENVTHKDTDVKKKERATSENNVEQDATSETVYSLHVDENIKNKAEQFKKDGYKNFERVKVLDVTPRINEEVKRLVSGKRYSINVDDDNNIVITEPELSKNKVRTDYNKVQSMVENMLKTLDGMKVLIQDNSAEVYFDHTFADEYTHSNDSMIANNVKKTVKMNAAYGAKEIVERAKYINSDINKKKDRKANADRGFDYYRVRFGIKKANGIEYYNGTLVVRKSKDLLDYAYDFVNLKKDSATQTESNDWSGKKTESVDRVSSNQHNVKKNYSIDIDEDGIENYIISEETKKLSYKERRQKLLDIMRNEFKGRTAKFTKDGKAYYAQYNEEGIRKGIFGDKKSDKRGLNAKLSIGAEGDYIELAENSLYRGSSTEHGKENRFHKDAKSWDYFTKK